MSLVNIETGANKQGRVLPPHSQYLLQAENEEDPQVVSSGTRKEGCCCRCCGKKAWIACTAYYTLCCFLPVLAFLIACIVGYAMGAAASSAPGADLTPDFGSWEARDEDGTVQSIKEEGKWVNFWGKGKRPGGFSFFTGVVMQGTDESSIPSQEELDRMLPVKTPYWLKNWTETEEGQRAVGKPGIRATWLGHATVLAEVDSTVLITDPIFSERASAVQWAGPKRYRPPACSIADLPSNLSAVVISHTHYDHLDYNSCKQLTERFGAQLHWFVPSGVGTWLMNNAGVKEGNVHDMVWWQEEKMPGTEVKFTLTPSNHWGRRGLFDEYKELWGSWAVTGPTKKFWFGGDTAYCEAFTQIGQKLGPFDLSAIPVGAYNPRWFMKWVHVDPHEAVRVHEDIGSKKSLGIHWGTFKLTYENYLEPRERTAEAMREKGLNVGDFQVVDIGETVEG